MCPEQSHGGEGTGAESDVILPAPAGKVVTALVSGFGVVRYLVLSEAACWEKIHDTAKKAFLGGFISVELTRAEFAEVFGVLLVSQAVGRQVVWVLLDARFEVGFPLLRGLVRYGENQVDTDGREAGFADGLQALVRLFG